MPNYGTDKRDPPFGRDLQSILRWMQLSQWIRKNVEICQIEARLEERRMFLLTAVYDPNALKD